MASVKEYINKMDTAQLDAILVQESCGRGNCTLSSIYLICQEISQREPARGNAKDLVGQFLRTYADMQELKNIQEIKDMQEDC